MYPKCVRLVRPELSLHAHCGSFFIADLCQSIRFQLAPGLEGTCQAHQVGEVGSVGPLLDLPL